MKEIQVYSEKEIAIFNGIRSLTDSGMNPYNIKVSDIAKASDVGKGTIYDYFDSKEEAISKSIIYNIDREINSASLRLMSKNSFKDKCYEIFAIMEEGLEQNLCSFSLMVSTGGLQEFYEYLVKGNCDLSHFVLKINNIIEDLLETGFSEGVISTKEGKYYQRMAIRSCIAGFSHYITRKDLYKDVSIEEGKGVTYRLLLKTLN